MISQWINTIFYNYDYTILNSLHNFAEYTNGSLNWLFNLISLLCEKGICMFLLGLILMCFKKTRKAGVCIFGAICCSTLITNFILKDLVARPRPFENVSSIYNTWWQFAGSTAETGYSFPSGHVTAAMSAMTASFLNFNKKYSWTSFLFVVLMGISRNYLMVHYPSDVLGAILSGGLAAIISFYITKLIFSFLVKYEDYKISKFILQFDIRSI